MYTPRIDHRRFQVNYSKRFTSGLLAGKLYHDHVRFATRDGAEAFLKMEGALIRSSIIGDTYIIEDVQLVDLREEDLL